MSKYNGSDFYDGREFYDMIDKAREKKEREQAEEEMEREIRKFERILDIQDRRNSDKKYRDKLEAEFEFLKAHSNSDEDYKIAKDIIEERRKKRKG